MKIFFSFLFLFSFLAALSQEKKRIIIDSETKKTVSYAIVKVLHTNKGKVASVNGEFRLEIQLKDSVLISSLGYTDTILLGKYIKDSIFLVPKISDLGNVIVQDKKGLKKYVIGNGAEYINKKTTCRSSYNTDTKSANCMSWTHGGGVEFAEPMMLPDSLKMYRLNKAYIPIKYTDGCWQPIFIQVYNVNSNNEIPGELIYKKYLPSQPEVKKGKIILDLSKENIYFTKEKKFFISISWDEEMLQSNCILGVLLFKNTKERCYSRAITFEDYNWFQFYGNLPNSGNKEYFSTIFATEIEELEE